MSENDTPEPEQPLEYAWVYDFELAQLRLLASHDSADARSGPSVAPFVLHSDGEFDRAIEAVLVARLDR